MWQLTNWIKSLFFFLYLGCKILHLLWLSASSDCRHFLWLKCVKQRWFSQGFHQMHHTVIYVLIGFSQVWLSSTSVTAEKLKLASPANALYEFFKSAAKIGDSHINENPLMCRLGLEGPGQDFERWGIDGTFGGQGFVCWSLFTFTDLFFYVFLFYFIYFLTGRSPFGESLSFSRSFIEFTILYSCWWKHLLFCWGLESHFTQNLRQRVFFY